MNLFKKIKSIFYTTKRSKTKEELDRDFLKCPNCKSDTWIEGAGGGSYGNIQCSNCKKKYNNLGLFGLKEI